VAAPLLLSPYLFDQGTDLAPALAAVGVWIVISYCFLVPAAVFLRDLHRGTRILYAVGLAAVVLAVSLSIAGGFTVAPALASIPLAASVGPTGRVQWIRAAFALVVLALACALYVQILVSEY
jgi:hypothetical protein